MLLSTLKKALIYFVIGIMFYTFTSCNTLQPDTSVPAYLSVDSVVFTDNPATQGYPSYNITNVWAYYNYNPIGVYDMPAFFPILQQGRTLIQLSPGIEDNGLQETRVIYPFYTFDTMTLTLQAGKITSFIPHITYHSNTQFPLINDFESANKFHTFDGSLAKMATVSNSQVKYGRHCGLINLSADSGFYQGECYDAYTLPTNSDVYVELDYMCNIPFSIGLVGVAPLDTLAPNYFEQINPISYWNKIYIDLTPYISQENTSYNVTQFQLAFAATLPAGVSSGQIYLDNIKLVHF